MKLFLLFLFTFFFCPILLADEVTHSIGNAVYAVRAARLRNADTKSPDHYRRGVDLLRQAQQKANKDEALHLAAEAEKEAVLALKESL